MNTDEDPQAELAALRNLLAAVAKAADVPLPEGNDLTGYFQTCSDRLNRIFLAVGGLSGGSALHMRSNAEILTRLAAEPLPYQAEEDPPAYDVEERGVSEYNREEFALEHPEEQP